MSDVELPPLPEPDESGFPSKDDPDERLYHSSDQMRAYARAAVDAALEAAAVKCADRATSWGGDPPDGQEREWGWMHDEAENCAAAIRAMKGKQ